MKQHHIKISLYLALLSFIGALAAIPYLLALTGSVFAAAGIPVAVGLALQTAQGTVMAFLLSWVGLRLGAGLGLDAPLLRRLAYPGQGRELSRRSLLLAVSLGVTAVLLIIACEQWIFRPLLPELAVSQSIPFWKGMLTFLQGGVYEEVLMRLFVMTAIVWLLKLLFARSRPAPGWMYVTGIVAASLLFGIGHLPAAQSVFGSLSGLMVVRTLVLNGLAGLIYGYLYWKRGLEYAIIAHAVGDIVLHGFFD